MALKFLLSFLVFLVLNGELKTRKGNSYRVMSSKSTWWISPVLTMCLIGLIWEKL